MAASASSTDAIACTCESASLRSGVRLAPAPVRQCDRIRSTTTRCASIGETTKYPVSPNVLAERAMSCTSTLVMAEVMIAPARSRTGWCTRAQ
jgi:hypothetical protein